MRRLLRHLFTLCAALSLLLCVAACVLWVRSYYRAHRLVLTWEGWPEPALWRERGVQIRIVKGHWMVFRGGTDSHLHRLADEMRKELSEAEVERDLQ